jgi:predicted nucleic acid-binding protein
MEHSGMVVDTNIFIEYLRTKDKTQTVLSKIPSDIDLYVTSISLYELLMGATSETKLKDVKLLTGNLIILPFDKEASLEAGKIFRDLRTNNKIIEFRDIFIGAICKTNYLPLKTLNKKHFTRIKGLELT